jgi:formylglycine-generating enzyme required for sulfatase activity
MLRRLCTISAEILYLLAQGNAAVAKPSQRPLEISVEVAQNKADSSLRISCGHPLEISTFGRKEFWVVLRQPRPRPQDIGAPEEASVNCGDGSPEENGQDPDSLAETPFLIGGFSIFARIQPWTLTPERVILLDIKLSLRRVSGVDEAGEPLYADSKEERSAALVEGGDVVVPLLRETEIETGKQGTRELFLRVATRRARDPSATAYGTVEVKSGSQGGELLLDGGLAGEVPGAGAITLQNVPAGLRVVGIREASGREITKVVRVERDRMVLADFSAGHSDRNADRFKLVLLAKNEQGYEEYRREADGAVVVRIPAGEFLMGNRETERTPLEHRVYVSEFLMDKTGVTWRQYKKFLAATGKPMPLQEPYWGIHSDHPAVFVMWEEAKAYCEWAGGRLPTEAEREKAARGTDERKYPWGDEEPTPELAVFRRAWGREATAAVGTHPAGASPYGLLDMGGNVWEWCSDWYDGDYYAVSPYRDPKGPATGIAHVLRGGSWDSRPDVLSASCRNWGHRGYREGDFGFRCAMNAPQ